MSVLIKYLSSQWLSLNSRKMYFHIQVNIMTGLCKGVKAIISSGGLLLINKHRVKCFYRWKDLEDTVGLARCHMDPQFLIEVLQYSHELITAHKTSLAPTFDHQHKLCRFIRCNRHIIQVFLSSMIPRITDSLSSSIYCQVKNHDANTIKSFCNNYLL